MTNIKFILEYLFAAGLTYFKSKFMTLTTYIVRVGKDGPINSCDSESSFKLDRRTDFIGKKRSKK